MSAPRRAQLSVTVDTVAPTAPVFTGLGERQQSTLTGTGEASTTVTILNGTTALGTATVGAGGTWSLELCQSGPSRAHRSPRSDPTRQVT